MGFAVYGCGSSDELMTIDRVGRADAPKVLKLQINASYSPQASTPSIAKGFRQLFVDWAKKHPDWRLDLNIIGGNMTTTEQARLLVYRLGRMKDAGVPRASLEASLAKLCASKAAVDNALDGMQIFGGYSCTEEYEIGRLLMEAKSLEFGEGTSELHQKMIAEFALGIRKQ